MKIIILAGMLFTVIFWYMPWLDIWVSSFFYNPDDGFIYVDNPLVELVYNSVPFITYVLIAFLIINLAGGLLQKYEDFLPRIKFLALRTSIYLTLVLALGPGLAVHNVFKEFLERPRPKHIIEFGGTENYHLPFQYNEETTGKSFVSGHASMGFYFVSFALLAKGRKRRNLYIGSILAGSLIGLGRIMQGKHFLSDVAFSGVLILFMAHLIHYLMYERKIRLRRG